jgi:hypothetical protein
MDTEFEHIDNKKHEEFVVVWVVLLYSMMVGYQHFGGPYCLRLQP